MYGKLFTSMYDGTLAATGPWQALVTFQQMIALADKDGIVDMTAAAISRRTSIPLEIIELGLAELMKPDPNSRTPAEEGRRIVLLESHRNWGWQLVNYKHYAALRSAEERREYLRVAQEKHRAKKKTSTPVNSVNQPSTLSTDVDVDVDVPVEDKDKNPPLAGASVPPLKPASGVKAASAPHKPHDVDQQVWDDWLALRKAKKAPVTRTVLHGATEEAEKAGIDLNAFLRVWCTRGTQGLKAEWIKPDERGGRRNADHEVEPEWRRKQRERTEAFIGKPSAKQPINMGEIFDVTATKLG